MHQFQPITRGSLSVECELHAFADTFPEAAELVESNPALALCLAHLPVWDTAFGKGDPEAIARHLLLGKRRSACEFLGFPGTEAVVKLLARIPKSVCYLPHILRLRRVLREQPGLIRMLAHLPAFDAQTLLVAAFWRWGDSRTISFFRQVAVECRGKDFPTDGGFGIARAIRRCHGWRAAEDNPPDRSNPKGLEWFPPAPRAGTAHIVELSQPHLLSEEGRSQHHCAADYLREVEEGNLYFYRVLEPERATLCLAKSGAGWALQELKAAFNAEVSDATRKAVEEWLTCEECA